MKSDASLLLSTKNARVPSACTTRTRRILFGAVLCPAGFLSPTNEPRIKQLFVQYRAAASPANRRANTRRYRGSIWSLSNLITGDPWRQAVSPMPFPSHVILAVAAGRALCCTTAQIIAQPVSSRSGNSCGRCKGLVACCLATLAYAHGSMTAHASSRNICKVALNNKGPLTSFADAGGQDSGGRGTASRRPSTLGPARPFGAPNRRYSRHSQNAVKRPSIHLRALEHQRESLMHMH